MSDLKLVLVTGAGASCNLSSDPDEPLPLMKDWAERLSGAIGKPLAEMTTLADAGDGVEFEETLGALFRWLDSLDEYERFGRMVRQGISSDQSLPDAWQKMLGNARSNAETFRQKLHQSLFREFGPTRVSAKQAASAYQGLFQAFEIALDRHGVPGDLICATTNYDRSLEMALLELGARPRTGFSGPSFSSQLLRPEGLGQFASGSPAVLYLHGAVGWYRTNGGDSIESLPADRPFNPSLGAPAVLYPGPDKDLGRVETRELWDEFAKALTEASHVFVLGHHLNDQHLVDALRGVTGRLAVSYFAGGPAASLAAGEASEIAEARINELLPAASPVAVDFGPTTSVDRKAISDWLRAR